MVMGIWARSVKGALSRAVRTGDQATECRGKRPETRSLARRLLLFVPRCLAIGALLSLSVAGQSPGTPPPGLDRGQSGSHIHPDPPFDQDRDPEIEAKRIKAINQMRHKAMVDDAAKLLLLAKELNDESTDLSAADRVRKATEIEKLAKSVKDKMVYSVGGEVRPPLYPVTAP